LSFDSFYLVSLAFEIYDCLPIVDIALHIANVLWLIAFEIFVFVRIQTNTFICFEILFFALHAVAQLVEFACSVPDGVALAAQWIWGQFSL
jgi:hypothetical protein